MFALLLSVLLAIVPFVIVTFIVYRFVGKKAGKITGTVLGMLLLIVVAVFSFSSSSEPKTNDGTISAGEKILSQVVERNFPGVKYTVKGTVVTLPDATFRQYTVRLMAKYDEASYLKFNEDACRQLNEPSVRLLTSVSEGGLAPQTGKSGSCQYWLSK